MEFIILLCRNEPSLQIVSSFIIFMPRYTQFVSYKSSFSTLVVLIICPVIITHTSVLGQMPYHMCFILGFPLIGYCYFTPFF